jgi:archaeosine-15-forming tRNA-guanine transglycosylase
MKGDGMKKNLMVALMSLLVLGFSMAAASAADAKDTVQTKTGTVKKVDVAGKQVVVMVARELTFTVTDTTKIVQGDTPKRLADIKVDAKVSVDYVRDGDVRTAKNIKLLTDK